MSTFWRKIKIKVLCWIDKQAVRMANRCNAVSSWCYYHAFTTKEERKKC